MSIPQNFTQALAELHNQIMRQTGELTTKAMELKKIEAEKAAVEKEIQTKEKEIALLKSKLTEFDRNHRRVADELTKIRLEQNSNNQKLQTIQRDSQNALKNLPKK